MVYSELKRLMLLVALTLLVGGISSGVVLSQEDAEGGKEPAAVEEAEDNQRAGLRVSLTRLAPPPVAEEEVAEADDGEGEAAGADDEEAADEAEGDEAEEEDGEGRRGRGDRGERPGGNERPERGDRPEREERASGLVILTSIGDVFQQAVISVNGLEAETVYQVVTGEDGASMGSITTQGEGRGAGSGALQLSSEREDDVDVDSLAGSDLSVVDGDGNVVLTATLSPLSGIRSGNDRGRGDLGRGNDRGPAGPPGRGNNRGDDRPDPRDRGGDGRPDPRDRGGDDRPDPRDRGGDDRPDPRDRGDDEDRGRGRWGDDDEDEDEDEDDEDRGRGRWGDDGDEGDRERPEPPARGGGNDRGEPDCESIRERIDEAIEAGRVSPEDAEARFAAVCGEDDADDADDADEADDAADAGDEGGDEIAAEEAVDGGAAGVANPHDASFIRGDVNEDKVIDISDSVAVISYLFLGEARPYCMDSADANDDGSVDISDTLRILSHLFNGGGALPQPFPSPGFDSTVDNLFCDETAF